MRPDTRYPNGMSTAPFSLIHVENDFMVINKAPDVDFHQTEEQESLINQVRQTTSITTLHPVHRLDRMTSGLLLFARNAEISAALSHAFRERQTEKFYLSISDRQPTKKQGWVIGDMERSRRGSWKLLNTRTNPSVTYFLSRSIAPGLRAFLLRPYTGRTHQLRVAQKSLGAPILGDPIYHAATADIPDRGYLHAYAIRFPLRGQTHTFCCIPTYGSHFLDPAFLHLLQEWREPWTQIWPKPPLFSTGETSEEDL